MAAKYILVALAALFFVASALAAVRAGRLTPQGRIWLLVAVIFGGVSMWLWFR